jgi:hypothetical protein
MSSRRNTAVSYDLFISYHPAQFKLVENFYNQVKTDSLNIWWDQESKRSPDENVRALQSSSIFVCVPSKQYQKSMKNRIEYSIALEQEMKIITLNVDEEVENETRKQAAIRNRKQATQTLGLCSFFRFIKAETDKFSQKIKRFVQTI